MQKNGQVSPFACYWQFSSCAFPALLSKVGYTYCFKSQPGWQHSGIAKIQYVFAAKNHGQVIEPNGKTCKEQKQKSAWSFYASKKETLFTVSVKTTARL